VIYGKKFMGNGCGPTLLKIYISNPNKFKSTDRRRLEDWRNRERKRDSKQIRSTSSKKLVEVIQIGCWHLQCQCHSGVHTLVALMT
jgi:hypothetical protein